MAEEKEATDSFPVLITTLGSAHPKVLKNQVLYVLQSPN